MPIDLEKEAEEFKTKKQPAQQKKTAPKKAVGKTDDIRDSFAAAALSGLLASGGDRIDPPTVVFESFRYADMMLEQRKKEAS